MQRVGLIQFLGLLLAAAALSSCSLRLPDLPAHTYRTEVSATAVSPVSAALPGKKEQRDPDVILAHRTFRRVLEDGEVRGDIPQ